MLRSSTIEADLDLKKPVDRAPVPEDDQPKIDWVALRKNPVFIASSMVGLALLFAFSGLMRILPDTWFGPDTLYSHGPLIPLMAGYIVWMRWDKVKNIPVKGNLLPLVFLLPLLYLGFVATMSSMKFEISILFIFAAMLCVWIVAGGRWMLGTAPAVLYLSFGLPLWTQMVDHFTQPMQQLSTNMAMKMLQIGGMQPVQLDPTVIQLNNYTLNVAAPCSGAKLTLALAAFTMFFILIGNGKIWQNLALVAIVLPFTLFINGFRIAMIGVVGNSFGPEAGHQFHDYGGYISLVVCFILLKYITRMLGFKS